MVQEMSLLMELEHKDRHLIWPLIYNIICALPTCTALLRHAFKVVYLPLYLRYLVLVLR